MSISVNVYVYMYVCFYSKTNQMHEYLKFILFWNNSTYFVRSFRPSSGVQNCTYSNRHLFDIHLLLYVQSWTPDDRWKGRPKHVELFQNKSKFETLVHLIDFTIEIYYDAQPYEGKKFIYVFTSMYARVFVCVCVCVCM
jgi:hypothetical protein